MEFVVLLVMHSALFYRKANYNRLFVRNDDVMLLLNA